MNRALRAAGLACLAGLAGCEGNIDEDTFALSVTLRVSRAVSGPEPNGDAGDPSVSADGRYVAFVSTSTNLVGGDTNGRADIFVRDVLGGTVVRASFDPSGAEFVDDAENPAISADGRYVAFECFPLPSTIRQIYRRDLQLGVTELVSETTAGAESDGRCFNPSISADGRFVAFESVGRELVSPADAFSNFDIFVRDMTLSPAAGGIQRASAMPDGSEPSGHSFNPSISADGRYVSFGSRVTGLAGPFNGFGAVYVRDMSDTATFSTIRVSVGVGGTDTNDEAVLSALSADGNFVAFESEADNLLPPGEDTNGDSDIFVWSRADGSITRVSVHSNGTESQSDGFGSWQAAISGDGRFVAFTSDAFNLVSNDANEADDVFVRDRALGITFRVSIRTFGEPTLFGQDSSRPSLSPDGFYVAFDSEGTNLVEDDLNGKTDVFLRGTIP